MTQTTAARHLRHAAPAALLAAVVAACILPGAGLAVVPGRPDSPAASGAVSAVTRSASTFRASAGTAPQPTDPTALLASAVDTTSAGPGTGSASGAPAAQQPSTAYEEWLAHESDRISFIPGGRVTVGFAPRQGDQWSVGGGAPEPLPAGRTTGAAMAAATQGSVWAPGGGPVNGPPASPEPHVGSTTANPAAPLASGMPPSGGALAPAAASALRRQVFGFLPYWQLSGASTSLNYGVLSTIAYFSIGADAAGNLKKRNADGSVTTGWAGWASSAMTSVINAAHAHGTRVVLTASVFAWTSTGTALQRALLGSATARLNLARQLAAAVRDRGADGVNLDFEPLVTGQEANFVALIKTLRGQLNAIRSGYQITYDTTGSIGNYPLEASVGPAAADAVFVMGYDYRTDGSSTSGSIDPASGPGYDLADTVREYVARISPSRVILGVPWYGRAWSTASSAPRSANRSGAKYGYSTAVVYANIPALVAKYGRRWDAVEQSPYIAYQRQNCTTAYGCVTSWRQVWYDDAASLAIRYQIVNDYGLRGAGIWALGYDGAYQDLVHALSDAFLVDHAAPQAGIAALPATSLDEGIVVAWAAADVSAVKAYDVQVSVDGGAWAPWLTATRSRTDVWLGADGHAYAFRVRATDAKGNVGAWNVTSTAAAAPGSLAVGGFGRVTLNGLAYRTGPGTSAAKLGTLPAGTVVALTSGPVSADGSTWFEVTQPIREWAPVSFVERGVWIAVRSGSTANVAPFHAPNATLVDAGIRGLDFGAGGATGSTPAAVIARTFSPNGDGVRDGLALRWTNTVALDSLRLNVLRLDGTLVGSAAVPALAAGDRIWTWDGTAGGTRVADGRYLLQLVGTAGARTFHAPSAQPVTASQIAAFAVTVDTVPPAIASASASSSLISPNGDGRRDTAAFALASPGAASWSARIAPAGGGPIRTVTGSGGRLAFTWDGRQDNGTVAPDGQYTVKLAACDVAGNCATRAYPVRVDTTPATVTPTAVPPAFSPNGDGAADRVTLSWTSTEAAGGSAAVWRGTTLIRRWAVAAAAGGRLVWDGRTAGGAAVPDGRYTFTVDVRDAAGNRTTASAPVVVDRTAGLLRWSRAFYPQDGDALSPTSTLTWRLTRTAVTTLAVYDATGNLVRTAWTSRKQGAGTRSWVWDGTLDIGTDVPQGAYTARLTVVSPLATQVLTQTVWASAFPGRLSATSVRTGQTLSVRFSTSESLRSTPRVTFAQPGLAAVTVTATRLADGTYRAKFTVRAGTPGAATVQIRATDAGGHPNTTAYTLAVGS